MKAIFLTFLISCIVFDSCKKIDDNLIDTTPKLPEATQEGKNTFGCYYNGILWGLGKTCYPCENNISARYFRDNSIEIVAMGRPVSDTINDGKSDYIQINLVPIEKKKYLLNDSLSYATFVERRNNVVLKSIPDSSWVQITHLDTIERVLSGLFHISFMDENEAVISLTNGRFDVKYNVMNY